MEEASTPLGSPVQIIEVEQRNEKSQLRLNQKKLWSILQDAEKYPIALVSIAGPSRMGKSFLLSYMLRYLNALEKGNDANWMGKKEKVLTGFPFENCLERVTTGFWMWSRPFIIKKENGEQLAILLMDTQGVFDSHTTKATWSAIVALCALTSSTLIYNLTNNLQEDALQALQSFVEYSLFAMGGENVHSKFEKLIFLIRDWNIPDSYNYGATGGLRFLEQKFLPQEHLQQSSKDARKSIQKCFQSIDCFLMPKPEEKVLRSNFKGTLAELDSEFKKYLGQFVEHVLSPEEISPKSFNGRNITAKQMNACFQKYVEIFSSNQLVIPQNIFEATAKASNQALITELEEMYTTELKSQLEGKRGISENAFEILHDTAKTKVFKSFEDRRKLGDAKLKEIYRKKLVAGIDTFYKVFQQNNEKKREKLKSELVGTAVRKFMENIEKQVAGGYILETDLEMKISEAGTETQKFLQENCVSNQDLFENCSSGAKNILEDARSKFLLANKQRKTQLDTFYQSVFEKALNEYHNDIESLVLMSGKFIEVAKLQQMNEIFSRKSLKWFQDYGRPELSGLDFYERYKQKLVENIEKKYAEVSGQNTKEYEKWLTVVNETIELSIKNYNSEFANQMPVGNGPISLPETAQFNSVHLRSKTLALEFFEQHCQISDVKMLIEHKASLSKRLEEAFNKRKQDIVETISNVKRALHSDCEEAEKLYLKEMATFISAGACISNEEITNYHQQVKDHLLENVRKSAANKNFPISSELDSLEAKFSTALKNYIKENSERHQRALQQVHNISKSLINNFKQQLSTVSLRNITISEWTTRCERIKTSILEKFASQMAPLRQLDNSEEIEHSFKDEMENLIRKGAEQIFLENEKQEKNFQSQISLIKEEYRQKMAALSVTSSLPEHHSAYLFKAINRVKIILETQGKANEDEFLQNFKDEMEDEFNQFLETQEIKTAELDNRIQRECNTLLANAKEELEVYASGAEKQEDLEQKLNQTLYYFVTKCNELTKELTEKSSDSLQDRVRLELKSHIGTLLMQNRKKEQTVTQEKKKNLEKVEEIYRKLFQDRLEEKEFWENSELDEIHQDVAKKATEQYSVDYSSDVNSSDKDLQVSSKRLVETLNSFKLKQNSKKAEAEKNVDVRIKALVREYHTKMDEQSSKVKNIKDLQEYGENIQKEIKTAFLNQCPFSGEEKSKFVTLLGTNLKNAYVDIELAFETKQSCNILSAESSAEHCKQYYLREMEKHLDDRLYVAPEDLAKWHKSVMMSALDRFSDEALKNREELKRIVELEFKHLNEKNSNSVPTNPAIGIDLGTTFCCVAVYHNGKMQVVPNELNNRTTPSYVAFNKGVELIGNKAKDQSHENPQNTIFDAKRLIGRRFDDPLLQSDIKLLPYTIVQEGGIPKIQVNEKTYHPEEISGKLLRKLKQDAETFLGCTVTNAVITVPAYFNDGQRQATKDAGELAGLKVLRIINEPSAAAFAYSLEQSSSKSQRHVLVFDFGGGTFDIAILKMVGGNIDTLSVLGDTHLGGEDFDSNLVNYCIQEFHKQTSFNLLDGRESEDVRIKSAVMRKLRRLRNECEKRKIDLSNGHVANVVLEVIHEGTDMDVKITRETFEEINAPLFKKSIDLVQQALKEAKLNKNDIDDIVLVGGSTRIPKIQSMLSEFFGGKNLSKAVNPDEAVACGAAIQAAILNGNTAVLDCGANKGVALKITDVTPYSYGIEVFEGHLSVIIPKNTPIPTNKTQTYLTAYNNQTSVLIVIYDGEEKIASNNHKAGEFYLNGIPSGKAGQQKIEVTMTIDSESILHVTASCTALGHKKELTIREHKGRLSSKEITALCAK